MTFDTAELNRMFGQRGTGLRPPVSDDQWNLLDSKLAAKSESDFGKIYRLMDGFANYDYKSQLRLWSIKEIVENEQASEYLSQNHGWIIIGDFLIDSDLIVINAFDLKSTVKFAYEDKILASNLYQFMIDITNGKFDFLR